MSEKKQNAVVAFIANHWVSWVIELLILGVVAYFTIAETRKTGEQTRQMMESYNQAISTYFDERTQKMDAYFDERAAKIDDAAAELFEASREGATQAMKETYEAAKQKASEISRDDVMEAIRVWRSSNSGPEPEETNTELTQEPAP